MSRYEAIVVVATLNPPPAQPAVRRHPQSGPVRHDAALLIAHDCVL